MTGLRTSESGAATASAWERSSALVVGEADQVLAQGLGGGLRRSVRLAYLDPPFNTGAVFAHYSDRRPRQQWIDELRRTVRLVAETLTPDGSVWLHLDDAMQHWGRLVLDEVLGEEAFVATVVWQKRTSRDNRKAFSTMHDYLHVYAPMGATAWKRHRNALDDAGPFVNPDDDPRGPWRSVPLSVQSGHGTAAQFYDIVGPDGTSHRPPAGRCWTYTLPRFAELLEDGRIYWPRNGHGKPRLKHYLTESSGLAPFTLWFAAEVGDTASAKKHLLRAFPGVPAFDTPKPEALLERIVQIATRPDDLVLDCFLGSGTTAVVAQRLGRRWFGVERNPETVRTFVVPRLEHEAALGSSRPWSVGVGTGD